MKQAEEFELRYEELNRQLQDPAVLSDSDKLQQVAKEHREVEVVVEVLRAIVELKESIEESQEIIKSNEDAELTELAREELPLQREELSTLEEKLQELLMPKDPDDSRTVGKSVLVREGMKLPFLPVTSFVCTVVLPINRDGR